MTWSTCSAGTLAGASGQSVDTLLDRVGNRRQRALAAKVGLPLQGHKINKDYEHHSLVCYSFTGCESLKRLCSAKATCCG